MLLSARLLRRARSLLHRPSMAPSRSSAASRLAQLAKSLSSSSSSPTSSSSTAHHAERALLGHLTLQDLRVPVYETHDVARLPRDDLLLDPSDPVVRAEIEFLMKKWGLGASSTPSQTSLRARVAADTPEPPSPPLAPPPPRRPRRLPPLLARALHSPPRPDLPFAPQHAVRDRHPPPRRRRVGAQAGPRDPPGRQARVDRLGRGAGGQGGQGPHPRRHRARRARRPPPAQQPARVPRDGASLVLLLRLARSPPPSRSLARSGMR